MEFPGPPKISKIKILASIVHHLRMNNVNVYVSKIYPSGLGLGEGRCIYEGTYIRNVNWVTYLESVHSLKGGYIYMGAY